MFSINLGQMWYVCVLLPSETNTINCTREFGVNILVVRDAIYWIGISEAFYETESILPRVIWTKTVEINLNFTLSNQQQNA